ncbi:MAG: sigma-54 dependent transcriptional regulator [Kiritimatiellia bacterium]|jgi:DNA-binding NtrC family response regulator|nr:sigma-54 dependent transcriptional regulator [Kiritimatiellia bacterium]
MPKILIVDDEARILLLLQSLLKANGYETVTAKDGSSALDAIKTEDFDLVISDLRMAPMDGLTLFKEIKTLQPALPVILLTAYASVETAIEALKNGAFDYLSKPFKVDEMLDTVRRAIESSKNAAAAAVTDPNAPLRYQFENLIATNSTMLQVCEMIQRVGPTAATVLINGESGTGKEVIARTIHNTSPRKEKPWVAVNCAALPENLLESEMFGHVKGAFTGAVVDKEGLFETANGGTLFLDEISSLPLLLQGKLLRVLQEKEIRRVGGNKSIPVDVRVIAASNSNLEQLVAQGTFRADLYYRFAVITLDIPALRDRPEDILPLARHFIRSETAGLKAQPALSQEAADLLVAYAWPGNVRELENAIKHAVTFLQADTITPDLLPPRIVSRASESKAQRAAAPSSAQGNTSLKGFLKAKEKEYLEQILASTHGDKEKAAQTLQVSLATLYRKLSDEPTPPAN